MRKGAKTKFARQLRGSRSDAETHLWFHLRRHQLDGFRFRRPYPAGPYIADFVCVEAKLVIELDGSQHLDSQPDSTCDEWFGEHGFRVLRFRNDDVLLRTQDVLSAILRTLSADMTQRLGYFSVDTSSTCG